MNIKRVHFIGIGGVSMSALAKLALINGVSVSGSDAHYGKALEELTELGAKVWCESRPQNLVGVNLVVYSSAIKEDNSELRCAKVLHIPCLERMDYLQEVCKKYGKVIAVAGTHGKTTVTAMLADIFATANCSFTAHIGGYPKGKSNLICMGNDTFITEACEYKRSFLKLSPDVGVITNVEYDHPDTYADESEAYRAFDEFSARCKGGLIISKDCAYYRARGHVAEHEITVGKTGDACYRLKGVDSQYGKTDITISEYGILNCDISLAVPGRHNVENALLAYACARCCGIESRDIKTALEGFTGVARRFEYKGDLNGAEVYSDYAHHPTELSACIKTAREKCEAGRVIMVFQPHTYSRTKAYFGAFVKVLADVDFLYLAKEYSARETPSMGATSKDLFMALKHRMSHILYIESIINLARAVLNEVRKGDILLIVGAGDIESLADLLI